MYKRQVQDCSCDGLGNTRVTIDGINGGLPELDATQLLPSLTPMPYEYTYMVTGGTIDAGAILTSDGANEGSFTFTLSPNQVTWSVEINDGTGCPLELTGNCSASGGAITPDATAVLEYCSSSSNIDLTTLFDEITPSGGTYYISTTGTAFNTLTYPNDAIFGSDIIVADMIAQFGPLPFQGQITFDIHYAIGENAQNPAALDDTDNCEDFETITLTIIDTPGFTLDIPDFLLSLIHI